MKTGKRVLSIILAVVMLLSAAPLAGFVGLEIAPKAKALAATGYCGSNVSWSFNPSAGALTISGTGKMWNYNYSDDESPFFDHVEIKSIKINNGITSIGNCAFWGCSDLTSVTIPNSVTSIGWNAFCDCSSLISVTIPNSVTSIGLEAFCECSSLTSVIIPNKVTSIEDSTFDGCSSLTSVTISNSVTSIGEYAFSDCSSLTSITIPNSVSSIDFGAFMYCSSLTSVTISNSVTSIGEDAFCDCSSLTSITIPNSINSIKDGTFSDCSSLTSVIIPNSVTYIGYGAFTRCSNLKDIYYSGTQTQWYIIDIKSYNNPLTNATMHYNSTGPDNPDSPENPHSSTKTFNEKTYIADIWLNQHKGVNTYESLELSTFLGYQSISTTLVNALLEDNWFKGALSGWEGFKGIFKTADSIKEVSYGIRELYEAIIFDLLEKAVEAEAGDYQNIVLDAVESLENGTKNVSPYMKFINEVVGSIGSSADVVRNLYLKDWHKSNISVGTLMNLDSVKQMSDKFTANKVSTNLSLFLNEAKSMADFFELVTSYQLAVTMGDEMKAFLSTMKSTTTDPYLESALGTVIAAVDNANWASIVCTTRFAENTAINVADAIIQGVINSNVYTAVLNIGYKVGKVASNLLSNTDGIISAYKACVAIDIFTNTSKKVISQLEEKYRSSGTETDAGAYVYAVKTYKDIYILDLERSVNLAKQASQKGIINLTKNKCKSLVNHILDKDETTTYEELCNSVETIKSSLELMFDSLFATWKYNTDYLKTDFPDQYAIYVKGDISSKLYAPQIVSTYLTNDGKVMLNYYNPCVYKDKTGTVHPLFGTAVLEGMKLSEVVNGAVTQELDFAYGFENQRVTLYDKNTFSDFPKTYLLRAYSTDTGSTAFTPTTNYELENPLKTPALVWTRGDLGQNCIGIIDETSSRYSPLMVYRIYRKDSRNGSFSQIATLKRDISITGNLTKYIDTTAQAGKLYIYKVQTEMKFSNGLSIISDESNEYELQGRANSRIDTLSLEVNFHGRTMKKTKGIAATAEDGENSVGVIINWISENNPSLYKYELYRKPSYSTVFEKVDCEIKSTVINMLSGARSYEAVDTSVDGGVEYDYLVLVYGLSITLSGGNIGTHKTYDPVPIAQGTITIPASENNCQHNKMFGVVEEATCSHAGINKYYCLYCGTEYENTIDELPHTYISSVTSKPTCSENGVKTYSCSVCGDTYTEPIPALGHIDEDNDGKCDREGCGEMMTGGDHCPQCGKIHSGGFFDSIVGFFHRLIYRLTHLFG